MATATRCPDVSDYERLLHGATPGPEVERLARHLEQCDRCAEAVRHLGGEDALVTDIRAAGLSPAVPPEPRVAEVIEHLTVTTLPDRFEFGKLAFHYDSGASSPG